MIQGKEVFVAAVGDANNPVTWSGIPYHFLLTARRLGLVDHGLAMPVEGVGWRVRRWAWNASRVVSGDRSGGYQYCESFLERLWQPWRARISGGLVINMFQLYPRSVVSDMSVGKWYYLDQTLQQLFGHYGLRTTVGRRIAREALAREREGYTAAQGVVMHSHWAARSVIDEYGIDPSKVHVIVPGANIASDAYAKWESSASLMGSQGPASNPVRFVFVGKDWQRKGLDRLLGALRIVRHNGGHANLRVIGCNRGALPRALRSVDGVDWVGFVDKSPDGQRFVDFVAECDVGCLLSRAEAGGMSQREFHALGLAVLGSDVGGAPEHRLPQASIGVHSDASEREIAQVMLDLCANRSRLLEMKNAAFARRHEMLWEHTVRTFLELWCS